MANRFRATSRTVKLTKAQTRAYENTGPVGDAFRREAKEHAQSLANEKGKSVEIASADGITFEHLAPEPEES
jgi:hypothetical protein